jgi:multiple sugar transport system substrate-binding protein
MKNKFFIIIIILSLFLTTGFGCAKIDKTSLAYYRPITLEYWRVWDDSGDFQEIISKYQRIHPNVTINYKKFRYEEYKQKLLEGFAFDRGPDIFSIHNTWTREYQSKNLIGPIPSKITLAYPYVKDNFKKELAINLKNTTILTPKAIEKAFLDVVYNDIIIKTPNEKGIKTEKIYGLPLSIDTLVMFYNKDLLNNAGIINPPEYWDKEFQQNVKKLTKQDNKGQILQSGVALGGNDNIERYSDVLALLMMQNGTKMLSENGQVQFNVKPSSDFKGAAIPGYDALRF